MNFTDEIIKQYAISPVNKFDKVINNIPNFTKAIDQMYNNLPNYINAVDQINNKISIFNDYYKYTSGIINSIYIPDYKKISNSIDMIVSNLRIKFPESFYYEDIYINLQFIL